MYSLLLQDIDAIDNKFYYKVRITSSTSSLFRDIRVRLADLRELHSRLVNENIQYSVIQFPPFPEKSVFNWFTTETREELFQHKETVAKYLEALSKNPPFRLEPLTNFLQNIYDPARQKELRFQTVPKEQLFRTYKKTATLRKKKQGFGKIFRVCRVPDNTPLILRQFLIPANHDVAKQEIENYRRAISLITDFTHIAGIYEAGVIGKKTRSGFFGTAKQKQTVYNSSTFGVYNDNQYELHYHVEELLDQPVSDLISLRAMTQDYFQLEQIADAIFTLVSVAQYFQFLQISGRVFLPSEFFYSDAKGFKVSGITPLQYFKNRFYRKSISPSQRAESEYEAANPPESEYKGNTGYRVQYPYSKSEVWQIGIILLCMSTLTSASKLTNNDIISEKLRQVSQLYGEVLTSLLTSMLLPNPYDRPPLQDVWNQCQALLPMKLNYINLPNKTLRVRINSLSMDELTELDKWLKDREGTCYNIQLNVDHKPIEVQTFLCYLERLKKEATRTLQLNIQGQELPSDTMHKMCKILVEYKTMNSLIINLKKSSINDEGFASLLELANNKWKKVTLDCTDCSNLKNVLQMNYPGLKLYRF